MLTSTVATLHDNSTHGDDNYLVRPLADGAFLDTVLDGVTGRRGDEASRALAEALSTAPLTSPDDLVAVLADMHQKLYRRGGGRFWLSTVSATLYLHDTLYVIGVGDSPVFLVRSDTVQPLFSHISGFGDAGITRVLGGSRQLTHLYRAEVSIAPGDRVVLATDGVTANLARDELVELVRGAGSSAQAVEQLQALLTTRRAADQGAGPGGGGFRRDDWTAIVRFFAAVG